MSSWTLEVLIFENENLGKVSWSIDSTKQDLARIQLLRKDVGFGVVLQRLRIRIVAGFYILTFRFDTDLFNYYFISY